ncbi:hypothetical protein GE21DRAFT_1221620, partial [Neurospora crassa]
LYLYRVFAVGYIDDIIVFNNIAEDYFKYLEIILKLFKEINFNIVPKKLFVVYLFVHLFSYCVDNLGITIITDYIAAI